MFTTLFPLPLFEALGLINMLAFHSRLFPVHHYTSNSLIRNHVRVTLRSSSTCFRCQLNDSMTLIVTYSGLFCGLHEPRH